MQSTAARVTPPQEICDGAKALSAAVREVFGTKAPHI